MYTWQKRTSVSVRVLHEGGPSEGGLSRTTDTPKTIETSQNTANEKGSPKDRVKGWFQEKRDTWKRHAMENQEKAKDRQLFGDTVIADRAQVIKDTTATDKSKILTHVYEKMMNIFRKKGLPEQEVINLSGEFMKQNGAKIQKDIQEHIDPTILQANIGIHANQFLATVGASVADKKYDAIAVPQKSADYSLPSTKLSPTAQPVIEKASSSIDEITGTSDPSATNTRDTVIASEQDTTTPQDQDPKLTGDTGKRDASQVVDEWNNHAGDTRKEEEIFASYAQNRESHLDFVAENHFDPNDIHEAGSNQSKHLQYIENIPDISIRDNIIDSPSDIAYSIRDLAIGKSERFDFPFEGGVTEIALTRQPNGDFLCQGSDNIEMRISVEEDPEKMLQYYSEIMRTPIVRRVLMCGIERFESLRKRLSQKMPQADTNPEVFIDMVLLSLSKKIVEHDSIKSNIKSSEIQQQWEHVSKSVDRQGTLVQTQSFLLNHRTELLNSLRIAGIIPESGVGKINPEVIL